MNLIEMTWWWNNKICFVKSIFLSFEWWLHGLIAFDEVLDKVYSNCFIGQLK